MSVCCKSSCFFSSYFIDSTPFTCISHSAGQRSSASGHWWSSHLLPVVLLPCGSLLAAPRIYLPPFEALWDSFPSTSFPLHPDDHGWPKTSKGSALLNATTAWSADTASSESLEQSWKHLVQILPPLAESWSPSKTSGEREQRWSPPGLPRPLSSLPLFLPLSPIFNSWFFLSPVPWKGLLSADHFGFLTWVLVTFVKINENKKIPFVTFLLH